MDFLDVAEDAALDDLDVAAETVARRTLVAHLAHDAVRLGGLEELLRLPERAHERLLHVDVLAHLHRADRDGGVHVVGRRDGDRIELRAHLVEHLAVVREERHLRGVEAEGGGQLALLLLALDVAGGLRDRRAVRVTERDDLGEAALDHRHPVAEALAHHAAHGEADLLLAQPTGAAAAARSEDGEPGRKRGGPEEASPIHLETHLNVLFVG